MDKVFNLSIKSPFEGTRSHCRQLALQYLLNYPIGKQIKVHLQFFLRQLEYDGYDDGRESALEMLQALFQNFPQKALDSFATAVVFVPLAARLINEESVKCRKLVGLAVKSLLQKVSLTERDSMFELVLCWLQVSDSENLPQRRLGAQLIGIFADVEGAKFERRVATLLPLIVQQLNPEFFEEEEKNEEINVVDADGWETVGATDTSESNSKASTTDSLLFMLLNTVKKVIASCSLVILKGKQHLKDLNGILEVVFSFLYHPHSWIRFLSAQIFGMYFASIRMEEFHPQKKLDDDDCTYLLKESVIKTRELCGAFCHQIQSQYLTKEHATQIVKNLLFLGKLILYLNKLDAVIVEALEDEEPMSEDDEQETPQEEQQVIIDSETGEKAKTNPSQLRVGLDWLVRRLVFEALKESTLAGKGTLRQTSALQWSAAMTLELGPSETERYLPTMLRPIRRILNMGLGDEGGTTNASDKEALKLLAKEVADMIKKQVGHEVFTNSMARVEKMSSEKRAERRQQAAILKVVDPEKAAAKKINRKRKGGEMGVAKGVTKFKGKKPKMKLKDLAVIE